MSTKIVKTCGCGREYTEEQWLRLALAYWTDDGFEVVEWRDCSCSGSTIGVDARDIYPDVDVQLADEQAPLLDGLRELLVEAKPRGYKATRPVWKAALSAGVPIARALARVQGGLSIRLDSPVNV